MLLPVLVLYILWRVATAGGGRRVSRGSRRQGAYGYPLGPRRRRR
jgi:hypothetical protein